MLFDLSGRHGIQPDLSYLPQDEAEPGEFPLGVPEIESAESNITLVQAHTIPNSHFSVRFAAAKRTAHLRQLRFRVPTVMGGIFGVVIFACLFSIFTWADSWNDISDMLLLVAAQWILCISILLGLLALLPTETRAVPLFSRLLAIPFFLFVACFDLAESFKDLQNLRDQNCAYNDVIAPCWLLIWIMAGQILNVIVSITGNVRIMLALRARVSSRVLLSTLWLAFGWQFLAVSVALMFVGTAALIAGVFLLSIGFIAVGVPFLIVGPMMLVDSGFRSRIQSWFISRSESAITAAGVAALLGGQDIEALLVAARSKFKFVRGDRVTYADMANRYPDPNLGTLAEKGRLGSVDAFVSHSWQDDSRKKWIALQKMREDFKSRASREPILWIDKYSLDQSCIDLDLASLPVYIAGCSELWILCGPTYLERLWCIVEIYVFIEMGGLRSSLHVELLDDSDQMLDRCSHFDPRKARCVNEFDTDRLHAVIETTGYEQICQLVKEVFLEPKPC